MNAMMTAILVMGTIALLSALVLYGVSKKFAVEEDPRVDEVRELLPGANCGGCGFAGCAAMAAAWVKGADAGSVDGLSCPVGGQSVMDSIAAKLGIKSSKVEPQVAVVRCNGTCALRPVIARYDGLRTCAAMSKAGSGESACSYGCLGCGDCVAACSFGALSIDKATGLPVVDEEKCTACGKCTKACPRQLIELRPRGAEGRRVYVACRNKDKGVVARSACQAACIGCGKCQKACVYGAITVENNLCYIDPDKCQLCTECVGECPTGAIRQVNFPADAGKDNPQKKIQA